MNEIVAFWESHLQPRRNTFDWQFQPRRQLKSHIPKRELLLRYMECHTKTKGIKVRWTYKAESEL